jgi:hypothetical protein
LRLAEQNISDYCNTDTIRYSIAFSFIFFVNSFHFLLRIVSLSPIPVLNNLLIDGQNQFDYRRAGRITSAVEIFNRSCSNTPRKKIIFKKRLIPQFARKY